MSLTTQQLATIRTAVNADANLAGFVSSQDWDSIANYANATASPAFPVWQTNVDVGVIYDAIDWTKFTPVDVADNTVTYSNRLLLIQAKQMNLQNILTGRQSVDASKPNLRAGLVAASDASAVTLLTALTRTASIVEKWLAGATSTTGTVAASLLTFEGQISGRDVLNAMAS